MPQQHEQPSSYSKYDRVRQETQWRERVREEAKYGTGTSNFQLNLVRPTPAVERIKFSHNRIELVTEKEHHNTPGNRKQLGDMDEGGYEVGTIRHLGKMPTEKWDLPTTSAHDVGWLLARPLPAEAMYEPSSSSGGPPTVRSARSETIPTLKEGKWKAKTEEEKLHNPAARLPDIGRLNTPRWHRGKRGSDVSNYFETYLTFLHENPFKKTTDKAA